MNVLYCTSQKGSFVEHFSKLFFAEKKAFYDAKKKRRQEISETSPAVIKFTDLVLLEFVLKLSWI